MARRIIAIVAGAVLANILGAVWYMTFQSPWMAAAGVSMEQASATPSPLVYLMPLLVWIVAGTGLTFLFDRLRDQSFGALLSATGLVWLSGAMTAVLLSTFFGMRGFNLLWIDGGYILLAMALLACCQSLIARR
jgi:hypothetical protein